jgi:hypothetical protein
MNRMQSFWVAGLASLVATAAWAADVTGTWAMSVESQRGTTTPTMTLTQQGEELSGTLKTQRGEVPIAGTLKGNDLKLTYSIGAGDRQFKVDYEGVVDGDSMSGKVVTQMGEGKFSGKKQ